MGDRDKDRALGFFGSQKQELMLSFGVAQDPCPPSSSMQGGFIRKDPGPYELGELDPALFLYLDGQEPSSSQEHRQTLNIFPSQPMHVEPSSKGGMGMIPSAGTSSKRTCDQSIELCNPPSMAEPGREIKATVKREGSKKGANSCSEHEGPKTPNAKTLRRLAQNREAARKSRLRKKAYVHQLENSRIRLNQLEQELQRARSQGLVLGGGGLLADPVLGMGSITSDEAAMFDMEYGRWIEDHHRLMCELRTAVHEQIHENELRVLVDNSLMHYDEMASIKSIAVKGDVFHFMSGVWKTPAERCFLWMGGFRPSEIIKVILRHIEPLTEQQLLAICALQQSTKETEEALTQGLEALHQSISDTVSSDTLCCPSNMADYMGHMAVAMSKLSTLEGFVIQADNLRQQTLHRLHQILSVRQAARCFLAIAEYFHRLRALSSLWHARPMQA